jgi:hypothetical protein
MQITREYRNELLSHVKPVQLYLYESPSAGGNLLDMAQKYQLTAVADYRKFALTVGDIILGFYKIEDTVPLLQQELGIDAKTAALLGAEVLDFLAPLSDPNWQPPVETDEVENISIPENQAMVTNQSAINPEPVSSILPELRTMAADMEEGRSPVRSTFNAVTAVDEPVYVSTQPTIEKPTPDAPSYAAPLYQPPKPNVDAPLEKPRWG